MNFLLLIVVLAVIAQCVSAGFLHKERALIDDRLDFVMGERANVNAEHEVVFAIKQNNLDALDKLLVEVSDPSNPRYGKYLSRWEIATITSNPEAVSFVEKYIANNGAYIVKKSAYGEFITARAPVATWEKLFATTFFNFQHVDGANVVRAPHYYVDEQLDQHISAVFNTAQLPFVDSKKKAFFSDAPAKPQYITPAVLNSYYNITSNTGNSLASQSLFESLEQYYSPSDLTQFQTQYNTQVQGISEVIGGHESDDQCVADANNCGEANLDVQYIMAVAQNVPTTYWYVDGNDIFVEWIQAVANDANPPLVHSISYGGNEATTPKSLANAFNTEAMKLGLQGISIFVSSGDDGVAGAGARKNPNKCGYAPSWPATSPYVTSVGATQGAEAGGPEVACSGKTGGIITTGGGFSTIFDAPSWQTATVANYFSTVATQPAAGYAASGRGYPDVSFAGFNYEVVVGGKTIAVSGTSASAPAVAGLVSLVNSARLKAGKSSLGFLNPAIYKFGLKFSNDITVGENNCAAQGLVCCSQGFFAAEGWDPLTGFGSINYSKFYNILANL